MPLNILNKIFPKKKTNTLYDIFIKKQTGKLIHKWHHYFEIYEKHFSKFQNKPVNILEIGVQNGGSLLMWKKYFGKHAKVFGIDIDKNCLKHQDLANNIQVFIGNAADKNFMEKLIKELPTLDIVIDDGGHKSKEQIYAFQVLYNKVSPMGGVYLVEDIHCNYWNHFDNEHPQTFIEFAKEQAELLMYWHFNPQQNYRFKELSIPPSKRTKTIEVPAITKNTHSITFYDSIVVFDKKVIKEPYTSFE